MFRKIALTLALTVGFALPVATAQAAVGDGASGVQAAASQTNLVEKTQFFWGGQNYCWYAGGWRGPGWYWCGYAWRRGYGWGGGYGWHGWHGGGGGWHGGHGGWRGGHGGWRGGHGGMRGGHGGGGHRHH